MTILREVDSAYPPTPAQIAAAKAAGISSWSGYFPGPNILNGWSEQNFHDVMNGGLETSAYCSGWADPVAMKNQATSWGVPQLRLDDESGIRSVKVGRADPTLGAISLNRQTARRMLHGGGARPVLEFVQGQWRVSSWVQPWLDASGAGQYGNEPVFAGVRAACYVFAAYLGGDPAASWPSYYPRPADGNPCGWQWQGTHSMFGMSVDATYLDENFFGLHGGGNQEEEMLYLSKTHPVTATLRAYAAGSYYNQPFASQPAAGKVTIGADYPVDGWAYSSTVWQSTIPAGADAVVWHVKTGGWVPDAILDTSKLAGAPGPAWDLTKEPVAFLFDPGSGRYIPLGAGSAGISMTDVQNAISAALAMLPPAGLTKDQVDQEILIALGNLPKPAPGDPHHHGVLGIVNTGPAVAD